MSTKHIVDYNESHLKNLLTRDLTPSLHIIITYLPNSTFPVSASFDSLYFVMMIYYANEQKHHQITITSQRQTLKLLNKQNAALEDQDLLKTAAIAALKFCAFNDIHVCQKPKIKHIQK